MKFQISIFTILILSVFSHIEAQTLFPSQEKYQHRLRFSTGLQPGFVQNLRYDYRSSLPFTQIKNSYFISTESALYRSLSENNALTAGTQLILLEKNQWASTLELAVINGRLQNKIYYAEKWEAYGKLAFGYFGKKAGLNAMFSYHQNLALHLSHTEYYTSTIFSDASDGWYKGVGVYMSAGLEARLLLMKRMELDMSIYSSLTNSGNPLTVVPVQLSIGAGWRL